MVADLTTALTRDSVSVVRCWEGGNYLSMPSDDHSKLLALVAAEGGDNEVNVAVNALLKKRYGATDSILAKNPKINTEAADANQKFTACVREIDCKQVLIVLGQSLDVAPLCSQVKYAEESKEIGDVLPQLEEAVKISEYLGMQSLTLAYKEITTESFEIGDLTIAVLFELLPKPRPTTQNFYDQLASKNIKLYLTSTADAAKSLAMARMFHYADTIASAELKLE